MDSQNLGNYAYGSAKIVKITFQSQDLTTGVWSNADPTTVTHEIETPDGVKTTYIFGTDTQIVKEAVGMYHHTLDLQQAYAWRGRWYGSGAVQEPSLWYLTVDPNPFA